MAKKPSVINSEPLFYFSLFITREEFNHGITALDEQISSLQNKQPDNAEPITDAPRPRIFHKKNEIN